MPTPKKPAPKKEYGYVVMAHHPTSGKPVPIEVHDDEHSATQDAVKRNKTNSHLGHHVKKFVKGTPT